MPGTITILKQGTATELRKHFARLAGSLGETLGSLISRAVVAEPAELLATDAESLLATLGRPNVVLRGALDRAHAGHHLCVLFEVQDACAMTGLMTLAPDDLLAERRARATLDGEDREVFGELGNVLCSSLGNVLRETGAGTDLRLQDHGLVRTGADPAPLLPAEPLIACRLRLRLGGYPETAAHLVLDRATAEAWNREPLAVSADGAADARPHDSGGAAGKGEDDLYDVPAAPVRGALNAYVAMQEAMLLLRRCCRRAGLELRRHGRAEIPNPAAHKGEIVLLDVPPNEERRFDWCRRIKEFAPMTKVVLLLHRPSRARVAQAFVSRADLIIGLPVDEQQLAHRLTGLLPA